MIERKVVVFRGMIEQCQDFIRANRFNVLLDEIELRVQRAKATTLHQVWAYRNDHKVSKTQESVE